MADNYMTYNDAIDVLTPYAEKINTIKPEPITWAAYQLLTTAQKEAKRYIITDYPSPTGYVNELADLEDVDINTSILVDGQMLVYNSTTQKWENKSILEDSLTSTATDKALSANQGRVLKDNIDDNFSGQSNENLLDNPFFTVNQRGVTGAISTLGAYVSDRWRLTALATATVVGNTITLSTGAQISQQLKTGLVSGKTYTLSIGLSNGDIEHATGTYNGEVAKVFLNNANFEAGYVSADYDLYVYAKSEKTITAVKLELGSISTLANDVAPDYALELAKCQTSTATPSDTYANQGQLMTSALQGVYGSKNLIPFPYTDTNRTKNGIAIADNGDGTVTLSGTAGADTYITLNSFSLFTLNKGTYTLSGCPSGGGLSSYNLYLDGIAQGVDSGDSATFTLSDAKTTQAVIFVKSGTAISTPITFSPMLCDARMNDASFVPYAPTNREAMSFRANGKVGAKNLLVYPYYDTSFTNSNITFTDNGDGTVTVSTSGASTAQKDFWLSRGVVGLISTYLENGTYKLSGCPAGGDISTKYKLLLTYQNPSNVEVAVNDIGDGATFTINGSYGDSKGAIVAVRIIVRSGTTIGTPIIFKPMIRIAEDTDPNYQPYAMTNRQLTEKLPNTPLTQIANAGTSYTIYRNEPYIYSSYCIRNGWVFVNVAVLCNTPEANWSKVCDLPRTNYLVTVDVGSATNHASPFDSIPLLIQNGELFAISGTANVAYHTSFSYPI